MVFLVTNTPFSKCQNDQRIEELNLYCMEEGLKSSTIEELNLRSYVHFEQVHDQSVVIEKEESVLLSVCRSYIHVCNTDMPNIFSRH